MNMRKNDNPQNRLSPVTTRFFCASLVLIYASLFRLIYEITAYAPFTAAGAERFGRWLEYPTAALMLLTAFAYLIERVMRENTYRKEK